MHKRITKKIIESISAPNTKELLLRDIDLKGFGVRISPSGTKTFFAEGNFNRSRQTKRRSLGRYPIVPLDTAKAKARELLYQWYIGINIEKKKHDEGTLIQTINCTRPIK